MPVLVSSYSLFLIEESSSGNSKFLNDFHFSSCFDLLYRFNWYASLKSREFTMTKMKKVIHSIFFTWHYFNAQKQRSSHTNNCRLLNTIARNDDHCAMLPLGVCKKSLWWFWSIMIEEVVHLEGYEVAVIWEFHEMVKNGWYEGETFYTIKCPILYSFYYCFTFTQILWFTRSLLQ